jgi:hypothetical protein
MGDRNGGGGHGDVRSHSGGDRLLDLELDRFLVHDS